MKHRIFIIALAAFTMSVSLISCDSDRKEESCGDETSCASVSADSLARLWNNAWNTKNLEAIKGMIADDAIAMDRDWKVEGLDSIMAKWISVNLPAISNLTTEKLHESNCCCCVSLTGFYTLDVTTQDGVQKEKGNFTFIWKQQEDKAWKLEVMHMTQF